MGYIPTAHYCFMSGVAPDTAIKVCGGISLIILESAFRIKPSYEQIKQFILFRLALP